MAREPFLVRNEDYPKFSLKEPMPEMRSPASSIRLPGHIDNSHFTPLRHLHGIAHAFKSIVDQRIVPL